MEDNNAKLDFPELPGVPNELPSIPKTPDDDDETKKPSNDEDIDFDDLTRRFEALKKKK